MKALVYHGPGQKAWETVPDPVIEAATDVIVKITSSTICGTDLHILKGDVPEVKPGAIATVCRRHGWLPLERVEQAALWANERTRPGLEEALLTSFTPAWSRATRG